MVVFVDTRIGRIELIFTDFVDILFLQNRFCKNKIEDFLAQCKK